MIIKNKQKSFTLIELLVVIVIIGILAGVIMISTSSSIDKANFAKAQAFSSTVQNELLSNLVSEWTFDEPEEGGKTKDTWGNNHGTVVGATQVDDCVFGKCYSFNGTSDYIECGNSATLKNENFTVTIWFNTNDLGGNSYSSYLIGNGQDYNPSKGFGLTSGANALKFWVGAGLTSYQNDLNTSLVVNKWYFATVTYEEGIGSKLYLNGEMKNSTGSFKGDIVYDSFALYIGKLYINYYFFSGLIDDIRIYNTALSSSQIKQNYIAGLNSMLSNGNISKQEYNERINALAYDN
jgi:prepilin-type N-terminal cleavage/methylation domain-containing protein